MSKSIEVTVFEDGAVRIEAVGFRGGACAKATAALEEAMGTVTKKMRKPEFFQQEIGKQQVGG